MGPLAWILPSGQSERQSKETEIWEIYLFPVLPHSVWVDVEASVLSVYTRSHPQVSHLKLLVSEQWNVMVFPQVHVQLDLSWPFLGSAMVLSGWTVLTSVWLMVQVGLSLFQSHL